VHLLDFGRLDTRGFEMWGTAFRQREGLLESTLIRSLISFQAKCHFPTMSVL
jgi:hypothetical protein